MNKNLNVHPSQTALEAAPELRRAMSCGVGTAAHRHSLELETAQVRSTALPQDTNNLQGLGPSMHLRLLNGASSPGAGLPVPVLGRLWPQRL